MLKDKDAIMWQWKMCWNRKLIFCLVKYLDIDRNLHTLEIPESMNVRPLLNIEHIPQLLK